MPILHVRLLPQASEVDVAEVMRATCDRVAAVLVIPKSSVWATWEFVKAGQYVEGDIAAELQPPGTHPPIVTVTMFEGRPAEVIASVLTAVAKCLCEGLGVEMGNAFITYHEAKPGQTYTGGAIRS